MDFGWLEARGARSVGPLLLWGRLRAFYELSATGDFVERSAAVRERGCQPQVHVLPAASRITVLFEPG